MAKKVSVKTKRILIEPMDASELEKLIVSESDDNLKAAYSEMLTGVQNDPSNALWHTCWKITLKDNGVKIGGIGFKGAPNSRHEVEIGYGIDENYRSQGYATEALNAMTNWAYTQKDVYYIRAVTGDDNAASKRLLEKCKFKPVGNNDEGILYEREKPASVWMSIYMCLGTSVGLCFGTSFNNIAIGLCLGVAMGLALGVSLDAADKNMRKRD